MNIPLYLQLYIGFVILGYVVNFYYMNSILFSTFKTDDQKFKVYGPTLLDLLFKKMYIPYQFAFLKTDFKKEFLKKQNFIDMSYIEYVITQVR